MRIVTQLRLQTFLAAALLLLNAACIVTPAPVLVLDTATPTATATPTTIWFPPTATATPVFIPTASPTLDMRPGIGELLLEDDFSDAEVWLTSSDRDGTVAVSANEIHLSLNEADSYLVSTRTEPIFKDFYAEITANPSFCRGEDEYGFVIRANDGDHYRFALTCDGRAKVDRYLNLSLSRQAGWLQNRAIPSLAPSSSRLAVWASGSQLHFFVNGLYLFSVNDTQLYLGTVGVFVHTAGEGDVSVNFSDLKVWAVQN